MRLYCTKILIRSPICLTCLRQCLERAEIMGLPGQSGRGHIYNLYHFRCNFYELLSLLGFEFWPDFFEPKI